MLPTIKKNIGKTGTDRPLGKLTSPRSQKVLSKLSLLQNKMAQTKPPELRKPAQGFSKSNKNLQYIFAENNIEEEEDFLNLVHHLANRNFDP